MRHGFGFSGAGAGNLPPGQEVEEFGPRVGDRVGQARRDVDQGAAARDDPLPDLAGGGFPAEDGAAMEGVEILRVAGVEVVAPALAREDGNEVEGRRQVPGNLNLPLPGEKAHAPGVGLDFFLQIDELNFGHPVVLLWRRAHLQAFSRFTGEASPRHQ
jgi:hypothetical protein